MESEKEGWLRVGGKEKACKQRWVLGREEQCFPPMAVCIGKISGKGIEDREGSFGGI
jgi:hypothetical protein